MARRELSSLFLGEYPTLLFHGPQRSVMSEPPRLMHFLNAWLKIARAFIACDKSLKMFLEGQYDSVVLSAFWHR